MIRTHLVVDVAVLLVLLAVSPRLIYLLVYSSSLHVGLADVVVAAVAISFPAPSVG